MASHREGNGRAGPVSRVAIPAGRPAWQRVVVAFAGWAMLAAPTPVTAGASLSSSAPAPAARSFERPPPVRTRAGKPAAVPARPAATAPCDAGPAMSVSGLVVDGDDLVAPDGTRYLLAGLAPGQALASLRQARLAALLTGTIATLVPVAPRPDRWNRLPVLVAVPDAPWPEGVAGRLVDEGLALARPAGLPVSCRRGLLAREAAGTRTGDGGSAPPLQADDAAAILALEGRFVVVEGRVRSIGRRTARLYLNFGTIWSEDFTVSIGNRFLRNLEASGMTGTNLEGRRVRVRGVVARSGGPLIEVTTPWDIERLD